MKKVLFLLFLLLSIGGLYLWYTRRPVQEPALEVRKQLTTPKRESNIISSASYTGPKKRLVYATHWNDYQINGVVENGQLKSKGLKQYLEEYTQLHPEIEFEIKKIPFVEYADNLKMLHNAGFAPEIYQVYAPWGVTYVQAGLFDPPPTHIVEDVKENYISTDGVTIDGEIWGIPTEINTYVLLYNKDLLREAGHTRPPKNWDEFAEIARKTTKRDEKGNIVQYGITFLKGDEGQVVDPFLSWLLSNDGQFIDFENKKSAFNSPEGVETLERMAEFFRDGTTDINGNFWKFSDEQVAMGIAAPWTKNHFQKAFGADFEKKVGVAPMPYMKKQASLQYSWFTGVMKESKNKEEAWKFLEWFTSEVRPETKTTRFGDLLANTIGAIPSRRIDIENHAVLGDFFTKVYVQELENGVAEPNVPGFAKMKVHLLGAIESVWFGDKTPKEALDDAAKQIDPLLK